MQLSIGSIVYILKFEGLHSTYRIVNSVTLECSVFGVCSFFTYNTDSQFVYE